MGNTCKLLIILTLLLTGITLSQDKGVFKSKENPFYKEILESLGKADTYNPTGKAFKLDMSGKTLPTFKDQFTTYWHNDPVSQGNTGTCWSFSTTSYFESEVYRIHGKEVKLSEMFTAYWEYVEKAKEYVKTRGESLFAEGSEANALKRIYKQYGVVPLSAYTGKLEGEKHHGHSTMYKEMNTYLKSVKKSSAWNCPEVISTIKSIMNHYMGTPPETFEVDGKEYTPKSYLADYLKLNVDDYRDILSYMQQPYFKQVEYEVPDNWWDDDTYYNVPLDMFMEIFNKAIKGGYSVVIGGDVSEAGKDNDYEVLMIAEFDIPSEYIDENARQFRFSNGTTTDDHGIHVVGYTELDGQNWYLIKDSGAGAFAGNNKGYFFYHEDYVKLKIMDFMVHKDIADEYLKDFK
ncbi:MAG: aminopeptidase [Melioribacteraceae bacterium]|nr:MAG: aminopeptidase [Melioribacteraceae bacterium]